jgi:hypothetical protein
MTVYRFTFWPAGLRVRRARVLRQRVFARRPERVLVREQARLPLVFFRMQQRQAPESWRREETFAYFYFLRQKIKMIVSCRLTF